MATPTQDLAPLGWGDDAVALVHHDLIGPEVDALRTRLRSIIDRGHRVVVVDLRDVDEIDRAGAGVLAGAAHRLEDMGGRLFLRDTSTRVVDALTAAGVVPPVNIL